MHLIGYLSSNNDNTTGATNTSSKIYLVGAPSQLTPTVTYSHDTVYVDTDGHLYDTGEQVATIDYVDEQIGNLDSNCVITDLGETTEDPNSTTHSMLNNILEQGIYKFIYDNKIYIMFVTPGSDTGGDYIEQDIYDFTNANFIRFYFRKYRIDENTWSKGSASHNYDADEKTSASNWRNTKLYLVGATQQTSPRKTYSNSGVFIGTDNNLYSNGYKVSIQSDIDDSLQPLQTNINTITNRLNDIGSPNIEVTYENGSLIMNTSSTSGGSGGSSGSLGLKLVANGTVGVIDENNNACTFNLDNSLETNKTYVVRGYSEETGSFVTTMVTTLGDTLNAIIPWYADGFDSTDNANMFININSKNIIIQPNDTLRSFGNMLYFTEDDYLEFYELVGGSSSGGGIIEINNNYGEISALGGWEEIANNYLVSFAISTDAGFMFANFQDLILAGVLDNWESEGEISITLNFSKTSQYGIDGLYIRLITDVIDDSLWVQDYNYATFSSEDGVIVGENAWDGYGGNAPWIEKIILLKK